MQLDLRANSVAKWSRFNSLAQLAKPLCGSSRVEVAAFDKLLGDGENGELYRGRVAALHYQLLCQSQLSLMNVLEHISQTELFTAFVRQFCLRFDSEF